MRILNQRENKALEDGKWNSVESWKVGAKYELEVGISKIFEGSS